MPGDIARLRLGHIIPADVELAEGDYLSVDQSALTGESLPVNKKPGEVAYSGSVAKQGEMIAMVTATGAETFFGKTAELVSEARSVSHFQKAVLHIGGYLIYSSLGLAAVLLMVQFFRGASVLTLIQFTLILVVAAIPVAMPAVLSVTMAIGARALARMKAIVTRLESIEEMAGMNILCSDKARAEQAINDLAAKGYRTLGVTRTDNGDSWQFLGILPLFDPPREDSAETLKQADTGIAVSGATDAARAASDLVLTEPGLSVIVKAVEEARKIFERMNSYAIYRITETIRIIFLKLAVAGHLTLFVSRTRRPFLTRPFPAGALLWSAIITKVLATLLVAFGFGLVTPISWESIGLIWAYCLVWVFIEDWAKLNVYRHLDLSKPRHRSFLQRIKASAHPGGGHGR